MDNITDEAFREGDRVQLKGKRRFGIVRRVTDRVFVEWDTVNGDERFKRLRGTKPEFLVSKSFYYNSTPAWCRSYFKEGNENYKFTVTDCSN